jgi:hypothetical protein|tara:strand:- start:1194 stop:1586 length:393 start_codon:yes stop_codon:yes gene_type:complete
MTICPCCGFNEKESYNPSKKIRELRGKRSRHTKKLLRKAINVIQTNLPSDNNIKSEYYLYQSISLIEDNIIEWVVSQFLQNKHYLKGKGFKYLTAMCLNHKKNRETISLNERLRIGKTPSIVKLEEIKND